MPTVLKSVLLPDMLEPLTMSRRMSASVHIVRHHLRGRNEWMSEADALKHPGTFVNEGREGVRGMLIGVGSQGIKRFVFPKRLDPLRDVRAEFAAPGFNRQRDLSGPQQERRHHPKQQIVLPLVHLGEAMKTLDCLGGWDVVAFEGSAQRRESSRDHRLPLDQQECLHEDVELSRRTIDAVDNLMDFPSERLGEDRFEQAHHHERSD